MPPELAPFVNDIGVSVSLGTTAGRPSLAEGSQTSYLLHLDAEESNRIVAGVEERLTEISQDTVIEQAKTLLEKLRQIAARTDLRQLPPLRLSIDEDGAALVEWALADRRLGFSIEVDPSESGWYFATAPDKGAQMASGELASADLSGLLSGLVASLSANSKRG